MTKYIGLYTHHPLSFNFSIICNVISFSNEIFQNDRFDLATFLGKILYTLHAYIQVVHKHVSADV